MERQFFMKLSLKPFLNPLFKRLGSGLLALVLVATLVLGNSGAAAAARSSGRAGGFRAPSRSGGYSAPSRSGGNVAPGYGGGYGGGGYYGGGGGMGFPFMMPFMFGGGGGLFGLLVFMAIASVFVQALRGVGGGGTAGTLDRSGNPQVALAKVQVGLLAQARELQSDLNRIALNSDTSTDVGRTALLQEAVLALLRHPEYWAYGSSDGEVTQFSIAESVFNKVAIGERSRLKPETLTNYRGQISQVELKALPSSELALQEPAQYIVVSLIVAAEGKWQIPKVHDSASLQQALRQLGSVSADQLMGVELLWMPQAEDDVLTADEVLVAYPELAVF
jgi:uncharacterized membrane protein